MAVEKIKILLVEDVPEDAELIQLELKKAGLDFLCATVDTREELCIQLGDFSPDVVISDYSLPGLNGLEVIDIVQKVAPHIPVIIATGSIDEVTAVSCMKVGAADYVLKEFLVKLGPAVESALERMRIIEEKNIAVEEMKKSRESLARAQEIAHLGSWDWNIEKDDLKWSEEVYRIFGLEPKDFDPSYETFLEFVHPDDREFVTDAIERALADPDENYSLEHRVVRPDGSIRIVHELGEAQFDDDGKLVHMTGTVQDITERKAAEVGMEKVQSQLLQSQKMEAIGRLAGGVAHDFNNMLTAIIGNAELLLWQSVEDEEAIEKVRRIIDTAARAGEMTKQLLVFSKERKLEPTLLDPEKLISRMGKMLDNILGEDIEYVTEFGEELLPILAGPSQVEQMVLNLVVNAREAMPDGGEIRVALKNVYLDESFSMTIFNIKPGNYVEITVSDRGSGIPEDVKEHIFEPFYTTKKDGTGLGLSTIYGIVQQLYGYVSVESETNVGTTFSIYLPAHEGEEKVVEAKDKIRSFTDLKGDEILAVLEDEPDINHFICEILEEHGYTVIGALNGEELKEALDKKGTRPSLLLSDVILPGRSGPEVAKDLLEKNPGMKVIFMSGYADDKLQQKGVNGADIDFLRKPFNNSELLSRIRSTLDAR
ncbi:MAG: response regulator [bacterium]